MPTSSIVSTLGSGSGIDTVALVTSLVDNQFAVKKSQLKAKTDALTAQISGVSTLKSAISGFSSALNSLVSGGTLTTSPVSSSIGVARVTALPGKTVTNLSATLDVIQLAKPQSAATAPIADRTAAIGSGSFTLTFGQATVAGGAMTGFTPGGGTPVTIAIPSGSESLDGIAAAINAAGAGITASVVGDNGGSRLVLKGATGASQGFTLESADPGLSDLNVGPGATGTSIGSSAQDAVVKLDGIELRRASNSINNMIDDVKLDLVAVGSSTLGVSAPTSALTQAVNDFVATYNQLTAVLNEQMNPQSGVLRSDPAAQQLQRQLARLPSTLLSGGGDTSPRTLAEIGVATNRDGTLRVDAVRLATTLTTYPAAVEALFAPGTGESGAGLAAALASIATSATGTTTGLGASETRYTRAKADLSDAEIKALEEAERLRTRLTSQFAAMDKRVAAYKSTQTFLQNQIDAWNKDS
ncbi:MAG: flagellar filament capping protein FliD [Pseudomonadota bacterium]